MVFLLINTLVTKTRDIEYIYYLCQDCELMFMNYFHLLPPWTEIFSTIRLTSYAHWNTDKCSNVLDHAKVFTKN